jgi:hypothetical protein
MTAHDFVMAYHNIRVPEFEPSVMYRLFGTRLTPAPVREYVNFDYSYTNKPDKAERVAFKDHLMGFFKKRAKEKDSGVVYEGEYLHLYCSVAPIQNFKRKWFMYCFGGKASPKGMASMAQLLSYWRGWQIHVEGRTNVPSVAELVYRNLGVDCNGFVGSYIRTKFAAADVGPSTVSGHYDHVAKVRRKNPYDLKEDDVVVFNEYHIAVVNTVEVATDHEALVQLSESRSGRERNGGAQTNLFTLRTTKTGWQFIPARTKTIRSIVRIAGMGK